MIFADLVLLPAGIQIALALILGLLVGSFLNVVIYRLPIMMERAWRCECSELLELPETKQEKFNLLFPHSSCPACHAPIRPWQNIPLFSYIWQKGGCASCGVKISIQYPVVELVTGLIFAVFAWKHGLDFDWLMSVSFSSLLIALAVIDGQTKLLPDDLTYPLLWLGIIYSLLGGPVLLSDAIWGAIFGYLALWSVYWLFKLLTGKEGMGYGDFKLLAALGAWLGWQLIPLVVLMSSVVGAVVGIALLQFDRSRAGQSLPFGPYLATAGLLSYLFGNSIVQWYWHG